MFDKLESEEQRYEDLMRLLGTTEVQADSSVYRKHSKALSELEPLVRTFREYKTVLHDVAQTEELAGELGPLPPMKIHCAQLVEGALRSALEPASEKNHPPSSAAQASSSTLLDRFTSPKESNRKITFLPPEDQRGSD